MRESTRSRRLALAAVVAAVGLAAIVQLAVSGPAARGRQQAATPPARPPASLGAPQAMAWAGSGMGILPMNQGRDVRASLVQPGAPKRVLVPSQTWQELLGGAPRQLLIGDARDVPPPCVILGPEVSNGTAPMAGVPRMPPARILKGPALVSGPLPVKTGEQFALPFGLLCAPGNSRKAGSGSPVRVITVIRDFSAGGANAPRHAASAPSAPVASARRTNGTPPRFTSAETSPR